MFGDCNGPVWRKDDFTACFQRDYLQTLLPLLASGLSFGYLATQSIRRTVKIKRKRAYLPLKPHGDGHYDRFERVADVDEEDFSRLTLHPTTSPGNDTIKIDQPRAETALVIVELLALVGEIAINLAAIALQSWGSRSTVSSVGGLISLCYILSLALLRLFRVNTRWTHIPNIWNHTAILYSINWLMTLLLFRSTLVHPRSTPAQILMTVNFVLVSTLTLIALTSRKGNKAVALDHEGGLEPSREPLASVLSLATFSWVDAIVWHGFRNTYEMNAVWNLMPRDKAAAIKADFKQLKKTSTLTWHLLKYFKGLLLLQAAWAAVSGLFTFVPTVILKLFLEFVEDPEATPVNAAWFYIILLALSASFEAVASGQALWTGRKISIRLRAVIISEIYAKSLRRKAASGSDTVLGEKKTIADGEKSSRKGIMHKLNIFRRSKSKMAETKEQRMPTKDQTDSQVNVGTIINLMAVDSFKVSDVCAYLHFLWASAPVQLVMCIVLLYRVLGYSSIVSIVLMAGVLPLNLYIAKQFSRTQKKIMAATDARIHTTNEVLSNIRIIKYFAWEVRFGHVVDEKRRAELKALRNRYILWTAAATIWFGVPLLITFFSFMIYTLVEKKPLIPSIAFTALSLFSILRIPLDQFADMLAHVQECKVSVDRVEEFLNEEETEKYLQLARNGKNENGDRLIGFDKATLTWGSRDSANSSESNAFRMIDLNIRFSIGNLNLVVGPTGSGKTSLLMALLGEMTKLQGAVFLPGGLSREDLAEDPQTGLTESVAYCAQQAWLVNDTIKQNIMFASPVDESRYKAVIAACALERDLEILDAGDQTLVGEKGITLSGGQKQRISLARALYCNSKHILLDDCLSAVDSHTAKHIFEHCIRGPLMVNRTCILVTHNTALCLPAAHHVVYLKNGKIAAQGSPDEVIATGLLGDDPSASRPSSKIGTRMQSRVPSVDSMEDSTSKLVNNNAENANGAVNGSAHRSTGDLTKQEQNANTRTEGKAAGGIKKEVIKLYFAAMGSWYYWVLAIIVFTAQQFGSVLPNVWIRQWANSYQVRNAQTMAITPSAPGHSYFVGATKSFSFSCLSGGTCSWNAPLLSKPAEIGLASSTAEAVNVPYYLGIYAALTLFYVLISMFREGLIFWGSLVASWKLHQRLLESVTRAKFKFFDSTPLGQIMNRFSKDIEAIDQEVAPIAVGVVGCLTSVVTIIILISIITPGFLIAGLFITALYFGIGSFYLRSSVGLKRLESVHRSPLYQQFGETLSGTTTIRAYGHERRFIRDNLSRVDKSNRPYIYLWAANRWLAFRVDITGALVSFFAGAFIILRIKTIDAGAAGLSMTYAVMFSENILWLVRLYSVNEQNMNSVERVKEYMDVEQEAQAINPDVRPPNNWPSHGAIEFIDYSTRYRTDLDPVLRNLSFKVQPSERVGIVGRTGAGKSSLALALFRGLEAEAGKITIDGVDIGLIGLQDLREAITIVPQDPTLFTGTIRSNLDPFGLFTDEEIFSTLRRVQLVGNSTGNRPSPAAAEAAGSSDETPNGHLTLSKTFTNTRENTNIFESLSSSVAESGSNLSQGQRQLLCLARALLKAPKVLLMDEATASIDYATDSKIQETLREVKDSTIITIAHRLQTIIDYDKVLVLDKGRLVEYGAPWELITHEDGAFRSMCEMSGDLETLTEEATKAGLVYVTAQATTGTLTDALDYSLPASSTCTAISVNHIVQALPQQCLTTPWPGREEEPAVARLRTQSSLYETSATVLSGTLATPTFSQAEKPSASQKAGDQLHRQPSESQTSTLPWTGGSTVKPKADEGLEATADNDGDSALDNSQFLSFEEWKKQNLAKAGQAADSLDAGRSGTVDPRRRPGGISNALDSLGEDTEIEIDFGGFVSPQIATAGLQGPEQDQVGQKAGSAEDTDLTKASAQPSKARLRSKDAGVTCKERSNYASFDCAATVLKTNRECKSATSVLVENKDSYMLNECSANNKFFIVELCDDILVDTVVLANFEFFSSIFRTFRVSVSDRYPVKLDKWRDLGTFEAKNSRGIQAFLIEEPQIWARYLRIEFLTHYGHEYYCPVSLLRVHGTTMMEEFNYELKISKGDDEADDEGQVEENPPIRDVVTAEVLKSEPKTNVQQPTSTVSPAEESTISSTTNQKVASEQLQINDTLTLVESRNDTTPWNRSSLAQVAAIMASGNYRRRTCSRSEAPKEPTITTSASVMSKGADAPESILPLPKREELNQTIPSSVQSTSISSHTQPTGTPTSVATETAQPVANESLGTNPKISSPSSNSGSKPHSSPTHPSPPNPTTQESFFKSVHKRLQLLESNSTLSLQYIEEQSRILRDAFAKVEKRQLAKSNAFLEALNATVLNEVREFRNQYDQIWQSTVLELSSQRQQSQSEIAALSTRLTLLADELLIQKRIAILQFLLVLLCLGLALFSRGSPGADYLEHVVNKSSLNLARYASNPDSPGGSPPLTRPSSRYGFFGRAASSLSHRRSPSEESMGGGGGGEGARDGAKSPSIEYEPPTPTSLSGESGRGMSPEREMDGVNGLLSPDDRTESFSSGRTTPSSLSGSGNGHRSS
ncbi:MAG: hypothetical protein Q9219_002341 [cf. Caloplaca sp. 3 TL-2023]